MKLYFFILFPFLILNSGCVVKKQYHDIYGFMDDNPHVFKKAMLDCKEAAYSQFPPLSFSMPPAYNPQQYTEIGGIGGARARGRAMADADNARSQAISTMNEYTKAREEFIEYCMQESGWHVVEVEQ